MSSTIPAPVPTNAEIGDSIRKHREHAKLSRNQLAAKMTAAGCPTVHTSLVNSETGNRPLRLDEAIALAQVFGLAIDVTALLDGGRMERERKQREAAERVARLQAELEAAQAELSGALF